MGPMQTGWRAFADADWAGARDAFSTALKERPGDPEALDGLGQSLWWLGEREAGIERRREAYSAYQRAGDTHRAGGLAAYLAAEHRIDGQHAAADGWLGRARRLLAGHPRTSEAGWLAIEDAKRAVDPAEAKRHAEAALSIAHELAAPDIECMALAQLGRAHVRSGDLDQGLSLLDEAMTVALGGEASDPLACGDACCTTLIVCDRLADLDRAAQWCEQVVDFTERRRFLPVQGWCRGIYAGVLVRAGDWERAESVLEGALRAGAPRRGTPDRTMPLAVLADLRLRQGRDVEAERLLEGLDDEPAALRPLVELAIGRGELDLARALLDRLGPASRDESDVAVLGGAIALAEGDLDAADAIAAALERAGERLTRRDLSGESALLAGRVAARRAHAAGASAAFERAVAAFAYLRFPLEEGRARLGLAEAQRAAGSPLAAGTARSACTLFERLGARRDADEAAALLRSLGASGRSAVRGDRDSLTRREREVLGLIAAGLSNREIAERMVIAPKTAEHHVGRVLSKLGVRSRAEAAAYAVREGL